MERVRSARIRAPKIRNTGSHFERPKSQDSTILSVG
jgi:hypothetical protein